MQQEESRYPSVRPYLRHSLVATSAVVLLPVAIVATMLALMEPNPPTLVVAAVAVLSVLGVIVAGTAIWMRREDSTFISFSDLMIARWMQRRRAEKQLQEGARLLGLDPTGQPVAKSRITAEEQLQVLKDLTAALEAKDPYTHGHSQRVERHSYRTAAAMGLAASDLEDIRKAAALHDVGKIRVPDKILRKEGPLTIEERVMIEEHATVGAWMVSSVGNADVISSVRHHHEHWDGSGYPDGLAGTDIPLFARIIAVADAYDALISTRPYRAGCGRDAAVEEIRAGAGSQFDPKVVESFIASLPTRLPVAAGLLVAFAGPTRFVRELFAWFRRFGAGSLSPAVGAAGAAVVLGASVFTPSLPAKPRPVAEAPAQTAPISRETALLTKPQPVKGERTVVAVKEKAPRDRVLGLQVERPTQAAPAPQAEPQQDTAAAVAQPAPAPKPEPQPKPKPEPAPEPVAEPDNEGPQGHDGCPPGHAKAKGEGHHKHDDSACS